jgi:ATP-dependent RNA helicase SUPV3L1/SUV3
LGEAAGVMPAEDVAAGLRPALKAMGITAGRFAVFLPAVLKPAASWMRALLWAVWQDAPVPDLPAAGLVSAAPVPGWDAGVALRMGWLMAGPVMLRLDIAERLAAEMGFLVRKHPVMLPVGLASKLSVKPEQFSPALNALGFRVIPAPARAEDAFGPPAPPMLARRRALARPVRAEIAPPRPDNPFAALAALKRAAV